MTTSVPHPPPTERSARLSAVIRAEISSSPDRRITFRQFMELALYHPELGYYRQPERRPTREGDFLTAPETHPMFGWTLARWLERQWDELDRPSPFNVVEYAAGSGTLALALLDGLRRHGRSDVLDAIRYSPVETNPHRLAELAGRFERDGFGRLLSMPASPGPGGLPAPADGASGTGGIGSVPVSHVLIANEFLDALPVHRVVVRDGVLRERFVSWRERFVEVLGEPSTPDLAARLAEDAVVLAEGQAAEICLEVDAWFGDVTTFLRPGGARALLLDYGYEAAELYGPRHLAGTLLGYRGHRVVEDPLIDPGDVDLTAHVDFTAVRRAAARHGFRTAAPTGLPSQPSQAAGLASQAEFLIAAGLESEWQSLREADLTVAEYTAARSAVLRLLDPRHLGGFRVLELAR